MSTTDPVTNGMTAEIKAEDQQGGPNTSVEAAPPATDGIPSVLDAGIGPDATAEANGAMPEQHVVTHAEVPTDVDTSAMIAEAGKFSHALLSRI